MKCITNIDDIECKTIKKATFVDAGQSVALIFTDGMYAFFDVGFCGDSQDIIMIYNPSDKLKYEAGIINKEEYSSIQVANQKLRDELIKNKEIQMLEELKAKYEK